jgi:hypothetical protein
MCLIILTGQIASWWDTDDGRKYIWLSERVLYAFTRGFQQRARLVDSSLLSFFCGVLSAAERLSETRSYSRCSYWIFSRCIPAPSAVSGRTTAWQWIISLVMMFPSEATHLECNWLAVHCFDYSVTWAMEVNKRESHWRVKAIRLVCAIDSVNKSLSFIVETV